MENCSSRRPTLITVLTSQGNELYVPWQDATAQAGNHSRHVSVQVAGEMDKIQLSRNKQSSKFDPTANTVELLQYDSN